MRKRLSTVRPLRQLMMDVLLEQDYEQEGPEEGDEALDVDSGTDDEGWNTDDLGAKAKDLEAMSDGSEDSSADDVDGGGQ